jgi:hypothetical protein
MAHQWRNGFCAITIGALRKTNGAKSAPLGFSNGAPMAQWRFARRVTVTLPRAVDFVYSDLVIARV